MSRKMKPRTPPANPMFPTGSAMPSGRNFLGMEERSAPPFLGFSGATPPGQGGGPPLSQAANPYPFMGGTVGAAEEAYPFMGGAIEGGAGAAAASGLGKFGKVAKVGGWAMLALALYQAMQYMTSGQKKGLEQAGAMEGLGNLQAAGGEMGLQGQEREAEIIKALAEGAGIKKSIQETTPDPASDELNALLGADAGRLARVASSQRPSLEENMARLGITL